MGEILASNSLLQGLGTGFAWFVTLSLFVAGLAGCVLPILPGHLLILVGFVSHRLMLGPESGIRWWTFVIVIGLMAASQAFEFFSGAAGARWFGGTRWGAAGALIGSIVGLFFLPVGLIVGPLAGAVICELAFAKKQPRAAATSGVGSVVGVIAGIGVNLAVAVLMIAWFFIDVFLIGK